MNILIPDSWLREHLKTKADHKEFARIMSLTSVSVERTEKTKSDYIYDIEVTTNRVDLMSITGLAREASAVLPEHGFESKFNPISTSLASKSTKAFPIEVINDPMLVNRICAVVMDVTVKSSPNLVSERLEASGIRSLNNLIDITNYVMRETGHPTHVFDFDRLNTKKLIIRKSKKGEAITTLDGKNHILLGEDIIAEDDQGRIVDLLGVMGTENSVVTDETERILFFVDNVNPVSVRNTSMSLSIRTEAAVINEKGLDPNLSMDALLYGIELFEKWADGKITSEILDTYPNKTHDTLVKVSLEKINEVIGVEVGEQKSIKILKDLGFEVSSDGKSLSVKIPTRRQDIKIPEDVIEEIARVYGYHKIPTKIPTFFNNKPYKFDNSFYYESRIKNAMKYLGFTEVYTYSLVSEAKFEGPIENAIVIKNPLSEDMVYLRSSLTPSLLQVLEDNKKKDKIKIFEIANVYEKRAGDLPLEKLIFSGVIKKPKASFFEAKGIIEGVLEDIGVKNLKFKERGEGVGAAVFFDKDELGYVELLDSEVVDFELDFEKILRFANVKKIYTPLSQFPPIIEDISIEADSTATTTDIINNIKEQSDLIHEVSLLDQFGIKKTFHIIYLDKKRNLTSQEVSLVREKVIEMLKQKFNAVIK